MRRSLVLSSFLLLAAADPSRGDDAPNFELRDGDRVVFVGNTFIERDQVYGYLETMLTARWPDRNITFRNLGWSGDTVWGEARARFGTPADGFQHLKEHIEQLRPTVILVGYGTNESFEGEAGLSRFSDGLRTLLDMLAKNEARIVLFSPLPHEALGPSRSDTTERNRVLQMYGDAIKEVASERGHTYLNLFKTVGRLKYHTEATTRTPLRLTDNGIHLRDFGYWFVAGVIERELGLPERKWLVAFDEKMKLSAAAGTAVTRLETSPQRVRFQAQDVRLPDPTVPKGSPSGWGDLQILHVQGLKPGVYKARIDGESVAEVQVGSDHSGTLLHQGPEIDQVESLRRAIIEKNRLYFHRWRPQNETYLFGFRKHEQGQNAAEVPKFDPLVEEQENLIARLRVPAKHTYEFIRQE